MSAPVDMSLEMASWARFAAKEDFEGLERHAHLTGFKNGWKEAMASMTLLGIAPKTRRQLLLVARERVHQDEKHGVNSAAHSDAFAGMVILGEEYGEACMATLHDRYGGEKAGTLASELIQVAAVAVAMLEGLRAKGGA